MQCSPFTSVRDNSPFLHGCWKKSIWLKFINSIKVSFSMGHFIILPWNMVCLPALLYLPSSLVQNFSVCCQYHKYYNKHIEYMFAHFVSLQDKLPEVELWGKWAVHVKILVDSVIPTKVLYQFILSLMGWCLFAYLLVTTLTLFNVKGENGT